MRLSSDLFIYDTFDISGGHRPGILRLGNFKEGELSLLFMASDPLPHLEQLREEVQRQIDQLRSAKIQAGQAHDAGEGPGQLDQGEMRLPPDPFHGAEGLSGNPRGLRHFVPPMPVDVPRLPPADAGAVLKPDEAISAAPEGEKVIALDDIDVPF